MALLGPSGCGKTTLLRLLAGFYPPDAGELWFGERRMNDVPPHRRNTGMVFQNYALWPHLTVAQNVAYGLEVRRCSAAERRRRVAEALAVVQMEAFAERSPNQLSGGQQQRVAIARSLVNDPLLILADEPTGNLDSRTGSEVLDMIDRLNAAGKTIVLVTHDNKVAERAHRVLHMMDGLIEREVLNRPVARSNGQPATHA